MKSNCTQTLTFFCIFACFCGLIGCSPDVPPPIKPQSQPQSQSQAQSQAEENSTPKTYSLWNNNLKTENANLKTENKDLKTKYDEVMTENENLKKKVRTLEANVVPLKRNMFLMGVSAIVATLFIAIAFLVFRSKSVEPAKTMTVRSVSNCPRCGWRIADGETICPNPECRTRMT